MFVRDYMTSPVVTATPDMPFQEALQLMHDKNLRRLPIIDKKGKLIGIVSERVLLFASPSQATTLSVYEMNYLLSKIKLEKLMTTEVITATTDTPIEEVADLMVKNGIGGVPIVDNENYPVGIITETDIFRVFVDMLGGNEHGLRLTVKTPDRKGVLAQLSKAIFDLNGNIAHINIFDSPDPDSGGVLLMVQDVSKEQLIDTIESLGDRVVDAREV